MELTAAASRAVDGGLFVLSSGIAASNPRSEHTGEKTSDQTTLARQAMAPSPVAVLESRNAAAPRKEELLDSDTTTEMVVKIAEDYQNRAFENIKASLNAASDHAPQPRYMRRLTDEAVRLLDDLRSGKVENQANFILSECFREAASAFSMINQQLKRDGYAASIDPSIFIWLANITEPETRDTGSMRLEIVPNHRGRPSTYARQVAQFIWHLEGLGCRRQAAYRGALTKFTVSASFAEKAYAFWEPIFKRAGPHVKMLTPISDPEM
ncbi:hypothetical protein QA640_14340 [Bradyrhizobium sp. CB82]|uniref:hypothetical protein n=1 Tax=Bradyrhizobium sp. CB82 TaxID=3039159 RepID=UPI0024B15757|nr:hypothetical protein [Bradyrhizobium sp. CB82]WFU43519.1 hypothetical protein QA640_14340 [Bradyrhizobium sp. CB82]